MKLISRVYMSLLLLASFVMLLWGVAGSLEYFTGIVPFIHLQNAAYPDGLQFVHWFLITLSGSIFLIGYFARWKWTPIAMVTMYSNLAVLCTIQTFDFMSEQWGYTQYFTEIISYIVHSSFLLFSSHSKNRFGFNN